MSLSTLPLERAFASPALSAGELHALRVSLQGSVLTPEEEGFRDAVRTWVLGVQHAPVFVVLPESAEDIATAVTFERDHGFGIAVQGTGHGATIPVSWRDPDQHESHAGSNDRSGGTYGPRRGGCEVDVGPSVGR